MRAAHEQRGTKRRGNEVPTVARERAREREREKATSFRRGKLRKSLPSMRGKAVPEAVRQAVESTLIHIYN